MYRFSKSVGLCSSEVGDWGSVVIFISFGSLASWLVMPLVTFNFK